MPASAAGAGSVCVASRRARRPRSGVRSWIGVGIVEDQAIATTALSPEERFQLAVRGLIYEHFASERTAPRLETLASQLGSTTDAVRRALEKLAEGRVLVLRPRSAEILSAPPFYSEPATYRVETTRGSYWASCIWEALAIPPLLGVDGRLAAPCPECGRTLLVTMNGNECRGEDDYVFHLLVPAARFWENIFFTCANQLLFCSEPDVHRWCRTRGHGVGFIGSLSQLWDLARAWYGDRLTTDFRRRTAAEAEALFDRLGLGGPFWELKSG